MKLMIPKQRPPLFGPPPGLRGPQNKLMRILGHLIRPIRPFFDHMILNVGLIVLSIPALMIAKVTVDDKLYEQIKEIDTFLILTLLKLLAAEIILIYAIDGIKKLVKRILGKDE